MSETPTKIHCRLALHGTSHSFSLPKSSLSPRRRLTRSWPSDINLATEPVAGRALSTFLQFNTQASIRSQRFSYRKLCAFDVLPIQHVFRVICVFPFQDVYRPLLGRQRPVRLLSGLSQGLRRRRRVLGLWPSECNPKAQLLRKRSRLRCVHMHIYRKYYTHNALYYIYIYSPFMVSLP